MHFVIFGLSLTSSWGNGHAVTYRGLLHGLQQLGHRVDFYERDVEWYAAHRDLPNPPQATLHLYRDWREIRRAAVAMARSADAVIVGSYFPDGIAVLDELLGEINAPIGFYDIDTPVTLAAVAARRCSYLRADQIAAVDLYLSFTGGPILEELSRHWHAQRVGILHCACDEAAYRRPQSAQPPGIALSFLGTFAPDRQVKFEQWLLAPARRLPESRFRVGGSMYPDVASWPGNTAYVGHVAPAQHPAFYAESRWTLNLTRQAMVEAGFSPSIRLFEAAACGTPIISDPWPGLEDLFTPGQEIIIAGGSGEVVSTLSLSLAESHRIGEAAQARVLEQHTCRRRALELEAHFQQVSATA